MGKGDNNKKYAALKFPENTVASIVLKRKSLEPPRLFLELAAWPNCAIRGEGPWSGRLPRT
jgi:hypothetical protein